MSRRRLRSCFWCNARLPPNRVTKDHLVPQWAVLALPVLRNPLAPMIVGACRPCNQAKGGMPPAVFYRVRASPEKCLLERRRWDAIRNQLNDGPWDHPDNISLRIYVENEMSQLNCAHSSTG